MSRRVQNLAGVVLVSGMLGGCVTSDELSARINGRWGPNPAIQAVAVDAVASNQWTVLGYLARNAGMAMPDGTIRGDADWYEVAQWGFNVGRQDCEIYLDNLFRMNREKGRNDNILAAVSTAAALIVTGTTTAQKPLSILAAAFGLSIAVNDAIFQSYMFNQAPGLVSKKVGDLQEAFRNSITRNQVNTPSSAYYAIQSYYHICLPHAIEGVLLQKIADSGPVTPGAGAGAGAGAGGSGGSGLQARRFLQSPAPTGSRAIRTPELR
jgi:hypothetical protein